MVFLLCQARRIYSGYNTMRTKSIPVFPQPGFYGGIVGRVSGHNSGICHCTIPSNPSHQWGTLGYRMQPYKENDNPYNTMPSGPIFVFPLQSCFGTTEPLFRYTVDISS